jgi:hypothetical protein
MCGAPVSGANVRITIFRDCLQFSAEKIVVFVTKMILFVQKTTSILNKMNANCFGENVSEMNRSVPAA